MGERAHDTRIPPQALEVEVAVLGAMLLDASCILPVLDILEVADFYRPEHGKVFRAVRALVDDGQAVDMATVADKLEKSGELGKIGGLTALIDIADSVFTTANAEAHARIIKEKAALRQLILQATTLTETCHDHPGSAAELIAQTHQRLEIIGLGLTRKADSVGVTIYMGGVVPEEVAWLWHPYIPVGKLTILEGDPGVGKTFLALQFAAIVSRGYPFPNAAPEYPCLGPSRVLILNAEDGLADTLRPRLDQAKADCSKIVAITGVKRGKADRQITLQDIPELEEVIVREQPVLVIVDPLQAYIGAGVDMHRANETRPILSGLASLAERRACGILCVRHLAKARADKAMYQGIGSIDFAGAARSIIRAGHDPQDESKRLIAHVKCSVAACGPSIGYELGPNGFLWTGNSAVTAEQMAAPARHRDGQIVGRAAEWLSGRLGDGQLSANEVMAEGRREGFGRSSLMEAKAQLGVESMRQGGLWFWKLKGNNDEKAETSGDSFS